MTKKIEELTQAQKDAMPKYVEKWTEIGLRTGRVNRAAIPDILKLVYETGGEAPVKEILYVDSPISAIYVLAALKDIDICQMMYDNAEGKFLPVEVMTPEDSARNALCENMNISVSDDVWSSAVKRMNLKETQSNFFRYLTYGQHNAGFLSFYDFLRRECGLKVCEKLEGLNQLAENAGWVVVTEDVAIVQGRPIELHLEGKQLHNVDGPALRFADNHSIYAYQGIVIPEKWIENPETLTPEIALGQENLDLRRAACELLGWYAITKTLDGKTIDEHEDPQIGKLIQVTLPDAGEPQKFLVVTENFSGRTFALAVPDHAKTALEAWNLTYSFPKDRPYKMEVRA